MTGARSERAIAVGVDASASCLDAVEWAAREAVLRGLPVRLIHGCVFIPARPLRDGERAEDVEEALLEHGRRWLRRAAAKAAEVAPVVSAESQVRLGFATDVLLAESRSASMLVVGSRGVGGLRGAMIGSVAQKVSAEASCPVIVVREPSRADGPVVAGVDVWSGAEAVLEFAFEAACLRGVPLLVKHVFRGKGVAEAQERRVVEDLVAAWRGKYPGVEARLLLASVRDPARALLLSPPDTQLIVVGSRGRGPVTSGLFGSTGNTLISRARCPVAVVHAPVGPP